jgi:Uma2 family endonuclease
MPELAARPASERTAVAVPVSPGRPQYRYTVEQYLAFERGSPTKHEYYDGNIYAMTGASRRHVLIVTNLISSLATRLRDRPCEVYGTDMRLKVRETGLYTYPDVAVACGEPQFEDREVDTLLNPQVVIEVLSKSTRDYDLSGKFEHYVNVASLGDYVLISQDDCHVEHRVRQSDNSWITSEHRRPDAVVVLSSIGCELPLSEIYRRIRFPA